MRQILAILAVLVFLPGIAQAATIHGNIYDLSLEKTQAVVEIDTLPRQQMVAEDGSYSFQAGPGDYLVTARQLEDGDLVASAEESVSIPEEGDYRIDLVLFPSFEEEERLLNETGEMDVSGPEFPEEADYSLFILIGLAVVIIVLVLVLVKVSRLKPQREERLPRDLEKLVDLVRREGGRTTQKELRKALGLSEAKVSLMVADLESRGIVRKIKKGRGNIVTMKK